MDVVDCGKLTHLSPFELKDHLMAPASSHAERMMQPAPITAELAS